MNGITLDRVLTQRLENLFSIVHMAPEVFSPSHLDFISLAMTAEYYASALQAHGDLFTDPPTLMDDFTAEEVWEIIVGDTRQKGLELLNAGLDIFAVAYSKNVLFNEIADCSHSWKACWKRFGDESEKFLQTILQIKEDYFFPVAENVRINICGYYPLKIEVLSETFQRFMAMIRRLAAPKESFARDNAYRMVISPEEADELYDDASQSPLAGGTISLVHLYECALAEHVIKHFIMKRSIAAPTPEDQIPLPLSQWRLSSSCDGDADIFWPSVKAGENTYPVNIIPPRVTGFFVRKDLYTGMQDSVNGVLCFSYKRYPSDEILVRFDNYIENNRFYNLLDQCPEADESRNIIKIPFEEVYREDLREVFLSEASAAVLGLKFSEEVDKEILCRFRNLAKETFYLRSKEYDYIVSTAQNIPGALDSTFESAVRALAGAMGEDAPEKNHYIAVSSLKETTFLDTESNNEILRVVIESAAELEWQCAWLFVDRNGKPHGGFNGPADIIDVEELNLDIPSEVIQVWFFIGPETMVNKIIAQQDLRLDEDEKLFWIIYGPAHEE